MLFNEEKLTKAQEKAREILEKGENKAEAVAEALNELVSCQFEDIIDQVKEEASKAESDAAYAKSLNLRVLSAQEKKFYQAISSSDIATSITAGQLDIIPTSIVDLTLEDVKQENEILEDVNFAPADVKRWFAAEKNGYSVWGGLFDEIKGQIKAAFTGLNMEVNKLTAFIIIPKAISDLSYEFMDKYFRAVLKEAIQDGLEDGYLNGTGKNMPIGIYKQIEKTNEQGEHIDKDVNIIKSFSPKGLAPAKISLSKNGKRKIKEIVLICNPVDEANYVAPALYDNEGNMVASFKALKVKTSTQNPQGKAALVIPKKFTMGLKDLGIKGYDQTLALDDADLLLAKCYANGRAVDDSVAYIFDVTKLEEYVKTVQVVKTLEIQSSDETNQTPENNESDETQGA